MQRIRRIGRHPGAWLLALAAFASAGCVQAPVVPPLAFVYTSVEAPLDIDFEGAARGSKRGTSTAKNVLGLVSWGDASAAEAARSGGITRIDHADYEFYTVLFVYSRYTTIVYGE
jgi:hypothetical protein